MIGALALAASCKRGADPRRIVMHDDGALCLGPAVEGGAGEAGAPSGVDLVADQPLAISVRSACLSNGCATARTSTCAVKREGERLVVTSDLTWIGPEDLSNPCPYDCTFIDAQCMTEALPAGSYKVVLGARVVDVALPSHRDVRCDREKPAAVAARLIADAAPAPATPAANIDPSAVPAAPGTGVVAEAPPGDTICIGPATASKARALKVGQPIAVTVLHKNLCLGASCTTAAAKCTVKRKGFTITLNAQFPASTTKPTQPCTEDCIAIAATCRTDALPAGDYTIELGTQRRTLQIPAATAPPCGP